MSTKNTLRVSFTILEKQIIQMLRFKAKITPNKTATKTAKKKCFLVFSTKSEKIAIQQSHIINPLLTSFARSVRESIAFGFYRTDLAPSSLGLYENLRQYFPVQTSHSVNKSLILYRPLSLTASFACAGGLKNIKVNSYNLNTWPV